MGNLFQTFINCESGTYTISWDFDVVPGKTSTSGGVPFVQVNLFAPPPNGFSPKALARLDLGVDYFNATVYKTPLHEDSLPVKLTVGDWKLMFSLYTDAINGGKTGAKDRIDNVVVKL